MSENEFKGKSTDQLKRGEKLEGENKPEVPNTVIPINAVKAVYNEDDKYLVVDKERRYIGTMGEIKKLPHEVVEAFKEGALPANFLEGKDEKFFEEHIFVKRHTSLTFVFNDPSETISEKRKILKNGYLLGIAVMLIPVILNFVWLNKKENENAELRSDKAKLKTELATANKARTDILNNSAKISSAKDSQIFELKQQNEFLTGKGVGFKKENDFLTGENAALSGLLVHNANTYKAKTDSLNAVIASDSVKIADANRKSAEAHESAEEIGQFVRNQKINTQLTVKAYTDTLQILTDGYRDRRDRKAYNNSTLSLDNK